MNQPYVLKTDSEMKRINMEGRYKVVFIFHAYDKNSRRKSKSIYGEALA